MHNPKEKYKILAVDDNPTNIKVIGSMLREAGYLVGFAGNGRKAIEILRQVNDFDLILMDINMPELNGFDTLRIIKSSEGCRHIPVIMLTAYNNIENIIKGFDLGAADYITKPFNSRELLRRVHTHIQLKRKTDQLQAYAREQEALNLTKDKFISIISHDLRNPIGAMQIINKMLRASIAKGDNEQTQELLTFLESTIEGGYKLLDNLLQWARAQTGKININPMELQLACVVDEVIQGISPQSFGKNISFTNKVHDDCSVFADADILKTILRNLLSNAVKYCQPGSGKIIVNALQCDSYIEVTVEDNGIGMNDDVANRIFRIDGNITSHPGTGGEEGTGMGLLICKEFVGLLGGTISAHSTLGQGSRFKFTLPVTEELMSFTDSKQLA